MQKFYVYALLRPGEHRPFYIGQTNNPKKRRKSHAREKQKGMAFSLVVLEVVNTLQEALALEQELILWYRLRVPLSNLHPFCPESSARLKLQKAETKLRYEEWKARSNFNVKE